MRSIGLYVFVSAYCFAIIVEAAGRSHQEEVLFFGACMLSTCVIACYLRASAWHAAALACAGIALALARMALVPQELPEAFHPLVGQHATLTATVIALPDRRETSERITVEIMSGRERTRVLASVPRYPPMHVADTVQLSGKFSLPAPFATDGGRAFAYDDFLRKDGIYAVMQPAHAAVLGRSGNAWLRFLRMLESSRDRMIRALSAVLPEPESSLAAGLLLGGKQGLGPQLIESFTIAGMLQIIVLSGYNVMIVANVILSMFRRLRRRVAAAFATAGICVFIVLAGAGSSALRAGFMAAFAISARAYGKQYDVLRGLIVSVFLLSLVNPLMLAYDPGFQLSCIATAGLILGVPIIAPRLLFLRSPVFIELVATTLAAEAALLPYLLWQTGNLSLVSVAANVIVMPAVPVAMGASALAALLAFPVSALGPAFLPVVGLPAYAPLAYIIKTATLFASLPRALIIIGAFPFWVVLLSYVVLAALRWRLSRPLRPGSGARPRPS